MLVLVVLFYVGISVVEIRKLKKENKKKEIGIYVLFMSVAFITSILLIMGVKIPSYALFIEKIILSITGQGG